MRLEQVLLEYGRKNDLGSLELDADGKGIIVVNDTTVVFEHALGRHGYYCYGAIGKVPEEKEAEITAIALEGDLFGVETGFGQLGYAREQKLLILFFYADEDHIDYAEFEKLFQDFVDHLVYWQKKLTDIIESPGSHRPLNPSPQLQGEVQKRIFYA